LIISGHYRLQGYAGGQFTLTPLRTSGYFDYWSYGAFIMKSCFHQFALHKRGISFLLIPAFLLLTLFPFHFHLHHADDGVAHDSAAYTHTIDLHVLSDFADSNHHKNSHAIDPTAYASFKISGLRLPLFILAFSVLLLLLPGAQRIRYSLVYVIHGFTQKTRYNTPPLRAPPRV
jgi:hypothetical protein